MFSHTNNYRIIKNADSESTVQNGHKRPRRFLIFWAVFLPLLVVSQTYIFLQPAVYLSKATVLTVAPADIDSSSALGDTQHVLIQKQILISQSLLEKTLEYLKEKNTFIQVTIDDLKSMLSVEPVAETNLVQLHAEGEQPLLLQQSVNAWIAVYLKIRAQFIVDTTQNVTEAINKEILLIEKQVEDKRKELESFRLAHDILSEESSDNQAHARLQGLNQTLNAALEEEVKTKAKLETIRKAVSQGKAVVPDNDSQTLADMMKSAQLLRENVVELESQYTKEYIKLNPNLYGIVNELASLEKKIAQKVKIGRSFATQEAENNYATARAAVKAIKLLMDEHKQKISEYTSQFSKYQALQDELVKLEALEQKTKQRLIEIGVKQRQQYPQVDVVEWASLPSKPIRPDYWLEATIAFSACLGLALFVVWIAGYLSREESYQSPVTFAGIHLHQDGAQREALAYPDRRTSIAHDPIQRLQQDLPCELTPSEVAALFSAADRQTTEILCLLFNGLTADEIANLTDDAVDLENQRIHIISRSRYLDMNPPAAGLFTPDSLKAWRQGIALTTQEIDALLTCAAIDGRLEAPENVNTEMIRFTYMLFLVRQGIKLSDLSKVFGAIPPARLVELGRFSPKQAGISIEGIDLEYPVHLGKR
jgi:uncharacterized protein involved in exopolysaccharide biosynthesis